MRALYKCGKKGIHRPEYIRVLSDEIVQKISNAGKKITRIITIAPEKAEIKHLRTLRKAGIKINMGHSNATYDECEEKKSIMTEQLIYTMQ